uniref:Uncharacterized protein n=1 Tax=Hyaloperonospora arabidopsidis (strain Emoy2) TaxID=559515 RepID=M4BLV7_HYAAE
MTAGAVHARLLQERIESVREQLTQLQDQVDRYETVAKTLTELPKKLTHKVMVPLGKRAMVPGKIVRSNEVLAHLGDEYFAWRSTSQAIELIERKKKERQKQIETQEEVLRESSKETDVSSIVQLKKMYEDENIREIKETEEQSELAPVPPATKEEEEERLKQEKASWNWNDMMKRMESLEALEAAGESMDVAMNEDKSVEAQAAALKVKGNEAFARRRVQEAAQYYSQAIELDPTSHILHGNRAAAYHRLKKYKLALKDADVAVSLHEPWVKGHYRRACALAALEQFGEAAEAFERATELCPTDDKLKEKAKLMREKASAMMDSSKHEKDAPTLELKVGPAPVSPEPKAASSVSLKPPVPLASSSSSTLSSSAFSGSVMEREIKEKAPPTVGSPVSSSIPRYSRFNGANYTGQTVTLEQVGEAQPVNRVSRFKAARAARGSS